MEDDDLLYAGLPNYSHHQNIEELENSKKQSEELVSSLKEELTKLKAEHEELSAKFATLSKNISSVIKTARSEIKRKDNRITELNKEILFLKTKGKSKLLPKTSAFEIEQRLRDRKRHDFEREEKIIKLGRRDRSQSRVKNNLNSRRRRRSNSAEDVSSGRKKHCDSPKENNEKKAIENSIVDEALKLTGDVKVDHLSDYLPKGTLFNKIPFEPTTNNIIHKNVSSQNSKSNTNENSAGNYNITPPLRVPNISMPTLYSQRMFRKIYQLDEPKKPELNHLSINNVSSSEEVSALSLDTSNVVQSNINIVGSLKQNIPIENSDASDHRKRVSITEPDTMLDLKIDPKKDQLVIESALSLTVLSTGEGKTSYEESLNKLKPDVISSEKPSDKPTSRTISPEDTSNKPKSDVMNTEEPSNTPNSNVINPEELLTKPKSDLINTEEVSSNLSPEETSNKPKSDAINSEETSNKPRSDVTTLKETSNKPESVIYTEESLNKSVSSFIDHSKNANENLINDTNDKSKTFGSLPVLKINNDVKNDQITLNQKISLTDFSPSVKGNNLSSNEVDIQFDIEQNIVNSLNVTDVTKNIQVTELKSIISNFNKLTNSSLAEECNFSRNSLPSCLNIDSSKLKAGTPCKMSPQLTRDKKNSEKHCSVTLGLKLTNRHSKTTFNPISSQWNETCKKIIENDALLKNKNNDKTSLALNTSKHSDDNERNNDAIMEAIFGSPLKWTENSTDEIPPKLCPPASAFEDSCSAQIENTKFKKLNINTTESVTSKKTVKEIIVSKNADDISTMTIESSISFQKLKEKRPFEQVNCGKNEKTSISSFLETTTEACDVPSFTVTTLSGSLKSKTSSPFRCPKYQDSLLGQFDDTTQLISALAKEHSKVSPINTPVKEKKSASPEKKSLKDSPHSKNENNKLNPTWNNCSTLKLYPSPRVLKKTEKKTIFLDKPINILCPRRKAREDVKSKATQNKSSCIIPVRSSTSKKPPNEKKEKSETKTSAELTSRTLHSFSSKDSQISEGKEPSRSIAAKTPAERDSQLNTKRRETESSSHRASNEYKLYYDERGRKKVSFTTISTTTSMSNFSPSPRKRSSPSEFSRNNRSYSSNKVTFKRPLSYERSRRRSNCVFRETSVERRMLRDNRHRTHRTPSEVLRKRDSDKPSVRVAVTHGSRGTMYSPNEKLKSQPVTSENDPSRKTTRIVRPSKKIDWSVSTTEVVSAQPHEDMPTPKSESLMKWVLQPIDLENNQSSIYSRKPEENQQTKSKITPDKSISAMSKAIGTPDKEVEKERTPQKSPVIIISRKRPVKFGVTEMSDYLCKTAKES